jgi:hypothetical protein
VGMVVETSLFRTAIYLNSVRAARCPGVEVSGHRVFAGDSLRARERAGGRNLRFTGLTQNLGQL